MGVERPRPIERDASVLARWLWKEGAIAGVAAAAISAVAITALAPDVLGEQIAGLYDQEGNLLAGVLAHVVHGTVFGVVFAAMLTEPTLSASRKTPRRTVLAALVFGLALAFFGAGVIMPMWLNSVGVAAAPPLPTVTLPLMIWHGVYGVILGLGFAMLDPGQ